MKYFYSIILTCLAITSQAQSTTSCSDDPLYHQLDFWVGDWKVYDSQKTTLQGENTIQKDLDGCSVTENWRGSTGGIGKSLFYVDNKTKSWKQVWVTTNANQPMGQKEKTMISYAKDSVVFQGTYPYNEKTITDRTILSLLSSGDVRQEILISADGGNSWRTTFVGIYEKVK